MEEQQEKTQGKKQDKKLWKIFWSTFYLSAFTFGGGYVIVSLMKKKFVDEYHWIEEEEMLDLVAIAQSAPGAIAVNGAIVIGYKLAGIAGILTAIAGTVIPPFLIISILSAGYQAFRSNQIISLMLEGMQAGVGAVIASVTYDMGAGIVKKKDALSYVLMVGAFADFVHPQRNGNVGGTENPGVLRLYLRRGGAHRPDGSFADRILPLGRAGKLAGCDGGGGPVRPAVPVVPL